MKYVCICRNKRPGRLIFWSNKKASKTHKNPSVLCTPPFEKSLFLVDTYFGVDVYFGKYGIYIYDCIYFLMQCIVAPVMF